MEDERKRGAASLGLFLVEAAIIAALFWADIHHWHHVVVFSKTPYLAALGWASLRLRGSDWASVGLRRPRNWFRMTAWGLAAGVMMEALELFVTQPLLIRWWHQPPDLSELAGLRGSAGMLALGLLLSWTLAAFGEELVWRGYVMNRIAGLLGDRLGGSRTEWAVAVTVSSVVFGVAHYVQGRTGIVENAIDGALLAGLYLAGGRNLWLPIVAHGITDSLDCLLLFSGHYPTM